MGKEVNMDQDKIIISVQNLVKVADLSVKVDLDLLFTLLLIKQVQNGYRPASNFSPAGFKDMSSGARGCC